VRALNVAILVCGVGYLLYVVLVALGTFTPPAHSIMKLRVHLRGGALPTAGQEKAGTLQLAGLEKQVPQKDLLPGHNQAPSLRAGQEPELEEMFLDGGDEAAGLAAESQKGDSAADAKAQEKQAQLTKQQKPLMQKDAKQERREDSTSEVTDGNDKSKYGSGGRGLERGKEGLNEALEAMEKEEMVRQQQKEQATRQQQSGTLTQA
jgi:hypothetical protein